MISYGKRYYYHAEKEIFSDPEWEEAEKSGERPCYYIQKGTAGIIIRKYKPSIAKLVMQRTGWVLEPLKEGTEMEKGEDDGHD